jgi:hypothetical protein
LTSPTGRRNAEGFLLPGLEVVPFKPLDGQLPEQADWPVAKTAGDPRRRSLRTDCGWMWSTVWQFANA